MRNLVIVGCLVWCWSTTFMILGLILGRIVMYHWASHTIPVLNYWGEGVGVGSMFVSCGLLF